MSLEAVQDELAGYSPATAADVIVVPAYMARPVAFVAPEQRRQFILDGNLASKVSRDLVARGVLGKCQRRFDFGLKAPI